MSQKSLYGTLSGFKNKIYDSSDFLKPFDEIFLGAKSGSALPWKIGSENGSELFLLPKSESGAKL